MKPIWLSWMRGSPESKAVSKIGTIYLYGTSREGRTHVELQGPEILGAQITFFPGL